MASAASTLELTLDGYAYGGEAIGRAPDGRLVFVPFAIPGERVRVEPVEEHKSWVRARLIDLLQPSPDRTEPVCQHFGDCGGCHYQHIRYPAQAAAKAEIVRAQLERLGGFRDPLVLPTVVSPSPWSSRNHMQFSLTASGQLGFQAANSHRIVPIQECHLPEPTLADLWPRLSLDAASGVSRVSMRCGDQGDRMVLLHSEREPEVDALVDVPASVIWLGPRGATVLAGEGSIVMRVLDRPFRVSATSFFQVHTQLAGVLVRQALDALAIGPGDRVLDLYAGVGLFSALMAQAGARVSAVEASPSACADFEVNLDEFDDVSLYQATVAEALEALPSDPDGILLDPPRAGLGEETARRVAGLGSPRLVYVSCDPATLARDGRQLVESGYRLVSATPFDLFPQTYHIETLSIWER